LTTSRISRSPAAERILWSLISFILSNLPELRTNAWQSDDGMPRHGRTQSVRHTARLETTFGWSKVYSPKGFNETEITRTKRG
jgi:hypothetical protein